MESDNRENNRKDKGGVKKMAVMTQSYQFAFIIDKNKVNDFDAERKEISSKIDYSLIIKQSKQIQSQIKRSNKFKEEE